MTRLRACVSGAVLAVVLGSRLEGATIEADQTGALWIADARGILEIGARETDLRFEIRDAPGTRALAVDRGAGILWAYGGGRLRAFDFAGRAQFSIDVPGSSAGPRLATRPLAVAGGGVVWLADGRQLLAYDASGQQLRALTVGSAVKGLALDGRRGMLWVASAGRVAAYGADDGYERLELAVGDRPDVVAIASDDAAGLIWVAHADRLQLHGSDGTRKLELAAGGLRALVADGRGGVWVASSSQVMHLDAAGYLTAESSPFAGLGHIRDLARDPTTGEVWAANESELARLATDGSVTRRLSFEPPLSILDLAFQAGEESVPPRPGAAVLPGTGQNAPRARSLSASSRGATVRPSTR